MFDNSLVSKLVEASPDEVTKLNQQQIKTLDDLWEHLEKTTIEQLAKDTDIELKRLLFILTKQVEHEVGHEGRFWLNLQWLDLTMILVGIVVLVILPLRILESLKQLAHIPWFQHSVVVSTARLPAFHVINPTDVQIKSLIEPNTFSAPSDIVGRYTLQTVSQGSVLRSDQVSAVQLSPADMVGRQILTLPIDLNVLTTAIAPGLRVSLLFSPSESAKTKLLPRTLDDVIILLINRHDEAASLVVAVKPNTSFEAVKPLLGASKVFVLQKMP